MLDECPFDRIIMPQHTINWMESRISALEDENRILHAVIDCPNAKVEKPPVIHQKNALGGKI